MKLKLMSYNICSCRDFEAAEVKQHKYCKFNPSAAAAVINKYSPDICGLNEVRGKGTEADFTAQTEELARQTGMNCYFSRAISFNGTEPYGNALLTKYNILKAETVPIPDPAVKDEDAYYETRAILRAELDVPGGLTVLVSHFGLARSERRNAVATVVSLLDDIKGPVILMGDFNSTPDEEFLKPIYEKLNDTACGALEPYTFASYDPKMKIDYIFTSGELKAESISAPLDLASDHTPYLAVVEL